MAQFYHSVDVGSVGFFLPSKKVFHLHRVISFHPQESTKVLGGWFVEPVPFPWIMGHHHTYHTCIYIYIQIRLRIWYSLVYNGISGVHRKSKNFCQQTSPPGKSLLRSQTWDMYIHIIHIYTWYITLYIYMFCVTLVCFHAFLFKCDYVLLKCPDSGAGCGIFHISLQSILGFCCDDGWSLAKETSWGCHLILRIILHFFSLF